LKRASAEVKAERIIGEQLKDLGWSEADLSQHPKSDPAKLALALRLRRETALALPAVAVRLHLGTGKRLNAKLHRWKKANEIRKHWVRARQKCAAWPGFDTCASTGSSSSWPHRPKRLFALEVWILDGAEHGPFGVCAVAGGIKIILDQRHGAGMHGDVTDFVPLAIHAQMPDSAALFTVPDPQGAKFRTTRPIPHAEILSYACVAAGTPAEFIRDTCGFVGWRDAKRTPSKLSLAPEAVVNWWHFLGVPGLESPRDPLPKSDTAI
jgi:hypothetical protein